MLSKYDNFRGVFAKDDLPTQINDNEMGIVNFDNHDSQGTHWVCYFNSSSPPENEYVLYFDSYGLPPPENLKTYLLTSGKKIKRNTSEIQYGDSIMCGYYCVYILNQLMNNHKLSDLILSFTPYPSIENENKIKNLF